MSGMINVDGSDDPSYRYKMPRLVSKVEGRGNGVKTVLVNCVDVAQALNRSAAQLTKYFGCELGAMTKHEEKIDRSLVNGAFENKVLQEALTGFIEKFVLCPSCNNPETVQELKGKKKAATIMLNCKACGAIEQADNTHKLVTFIVKELSPEEGKSKKEARKEKKMAKNKKSDRKKRDSGESVDDSVSAGENKEEDEQDKKKKKKKKHKVRDDNGEEKKERKSRKAKVKESSSKEIPADSSSNSEAEVEIAINGGIKAMALEKKPSENGISVHDVAAIDASVEALVKVITENKDVKDEELLKKAGDLQVNSGLRKVDQLPMLFFALVNPQHNVTVVLGKIALLENVKAHFASNTAFQNEVLLCLEEVTGRELEAQKKEQITKILPLVLKQLYDDELLEETTIKQWFEGKLDEDKFKHQRAVVGPAEAQKVKASVKVIIDWFEDAETGSESDDEEDDE